MYDNQYNAGAIQSNQLRGFCPCKNNGCSNACTVARKEKGVVTCMRSCTGSCAASCGTKSLF